jgi:predicted ATP-grasp superfamily ATP-dependent carboligase
MRQILDKKFLSEAAIRAGVDVLPTWDPQSLDEVAALAPDLPFPVLLKPRSSVQRLRNDKGMVANTSSELIEKFSEYTLRERVAPSAAENRFLPDGRLPLIQQFVRGAIRAVYSLTGFMDRTGELFVTRAGVKVLMRSQPVGVGVCFESLPPAPALSESVRRLCRELGYFGLFEVEFIRYGEKWAAIDFNPRLFNQVGMDIRRGMPLPLLACLDAAGETEALRDAVNAAELSSESKAVFCDGFTMRATLLARTLTGRISSEEKARWRAWLRDNADRLVDYALDPSDRKPGFAHALSEVYLGLKAVPKFLRATPRVSERAVSSSASAKL